MVEVFESKSLGGIIFYIHILHWSRKDGIYSKS